MFLDGFSLFLSVLAGFLVFLDDFHCFQEFLGLFDGFYRFLSVFAEFLVFLDRFSLFLSV